jgi:dolichyl-phosphate-mannose--protein O-mannosyl transferase
MNAIPWILVTILILAVLLGAVLLLIVRSKQPRRVNYRSYFVMGIVWIPTGVVLSLLPWLLHGEDISFIGLFFVTVGLAYTAIGLINRDKWGKQVEESPAARKGLVLVVVVGLLLLFLGLITFELFG